MGRWLAGSFIFVDAAAFRKLGGFSDKFFAAEELDLSRRLKKMALGTGKGIIISAPASAVDLRAQAAALLGAGTI